MLEVDANVLNVLYCEIDTVPEPGAAAVLYIHLGVPDQEADLWIYVQNIVRYECVSAMYT